uniref:SH3GL interacting endocytic adaptor 1 n=1 Tax=Leptobrachium leishanense TaxID=445787 RepID=A0A8C5Q6G7_9ANUR
MANVTSLLERRARLYDHMKAFGIRKKEKDTDSTGSPDREGSVSKCLTTTYLMLLPGFSEYAYTTLLEIALLFFFKSKKANGAPNGFYAEIDWERYNSPELDEEGYSIRPDMEPGGKHFYSSSESEEEQESRKKFNIKIKPLQAKDSLKSAATVDELKASIGNIALSPSPVVRGLAANVCEEIARPRRTTPTAEIFFFFNLFFFFIYFFFLFLFFLFSLSIKKKISVSLDQSEIWGMSQAASPEQESPKQSRPFPAGTPPPIPPKSIPATPPRTASPLPAEAGPEQKEVIEDALLPSINDLDSIFGPVLSPKMVTVDSEDKWVRFADPSPEQITPELPARKTAESPADIQKKIIEQSFIKDDVLETAVSPKDFGSGQRATPPPPPPPTYRAVVSSPGPIASSNTGCASGTSSPARPATPLAICSTTPPPPPPRPPSRPKPPPGKPAVSDVSQRRIPSHHFVVLSCSDSVSFSLPLLKPPLPAYTPVHTENEQPSLIWFDRGKFYLTFEGSSRGPSPLTMGAQDTLPVAAAFTETVNAYFKGADPNKCIVKITGEMVLSFPAGITRHFSNNPAPATLMFRIMNYSRLEHVLPNPQLLFFTNAKEFWVNMPNLMTHLKKVSEQKPQATYYNVDMLKYQVSTQGLQSTPLNLAFSWRCEPENTDLRVDYKYNPDAMTTPVALNNVQFVVPIDGNVTKLQAVLPPAVWSAEQQRILWKIPDISQKSENGGVGSLLARFLLSEGPSKPAPLVVQFTSEGSTLSGCDIELVGGGYRFSLIKKRFAAGEDLKTTFMHSV